MCRGEPVSWGMHEAPFDQGSEGKRLPVPDKPGNGRGATQCFFPVLPHFTAYSVLGQHQNPGYLSHMPGPQNAQTCCKSLWGRHQRRNKEAHEGPGVPASSWSTLKGFSDCQSLALGLDITRDPYITYLNIALKIVFPFIVGGKSHVSNGQNVPFKEP